MIPNPTNAAVLLIAIAPSAVLITLNLPLVGRWGQRNLL